MIAPLLSIIIANYNTADVTVNCLQSIYQDKGLKNIPFEVILVDNNSTDDSLLKIKELKKSLDIRNSKLEIICNSTNVGYGKANNQGFKIAKGNYFLLLNTDTVILHSAISQSLNWLSSHPEVGTCTAQLLNPDKTVQMSGGFFPNLANIFTWSTGLDDLPLVNRFIPPFHPHTPHFYTHDHFFLRDHRQDWVTGAFMLVRRELIDKTGGFDEHYFMYGEEYELSYRIHLLFPQLQTWYLVGPQITHLGRGSSTNTTAPIVKEYQGVRSFFNKHHPQQLATINFFLHLNQFFRQSAYLIFKKDV